MNLMSRKESNDQTNRNYIQIKAWRKKNSSQLSDFQSLYGSLNQSINEEQISDFRLNHNTNSGSNPNNNSSINRSSSREDSFYSVNSDLQQDMGGSSIGKEKEDYRDEEFKSFKENNSMVNFNQVNAYVAANTAFSGRTANQDEDRELYNSIQDQGFHTPKNQGSFENDNDQYKQSQEIEQKQYIYKLSNASQRYSDTHTSYQQQNYQNYNKNGRFSQQPLSRPNNYLSINQRKSDTSSQDDQSQRSSIYNTSHPFMQSQKNQQDENRRSIGQPLLADNGLKKIKNSVQFNNQSNQNLKIQNKNQTSSVLGKANNSQIENERHLQDKKNKINRGKSLSTLKKLIQNNQQQQNGDEDDQDEANYLSQLENQGQYNQYQQNQNSNMDQQSRKNTPQSHQRIKSQSKSTTTHLNSVGDQIIEQQLQQKNSQSNVKLEKSESSLYEKHLNQFLYYERLKKKQKFRIAHNNRLIERKKNDYMSNPLQEQKQSRFTMNLTFLIHIILEKHPKLKYLLFLNHVIGAISRGFVYFFLIIISIRASQYFIIFGTAILLTRFYYILSMYYVLFYFEQKSLSFRKISKIFNNFFQLPSEYKKPVMSEMIDMIDFNLRDQEEKLMKRKFVFCPVEINHLCLHNQDTRKKWNLFYISNFIYQGIESIFLYPIVIAISVHYYEQGQVLIGIDFLMFSRYTIIGSISIFFIFCLFILIYGNKNFKVN